MIGNTIADKDELVKVGGEKGVRVQILLTVREGGEVLLCELVQILEDYVQEIIEVVFVNMVIYENDVINVAIINEKGLHFKQYLFFPLSIVVIHHQLLILDCLRVVHYSQVTISQIQILKIHQV